MRKIQEFASTLYWRFLDSTYKLWPDALWLKIIYRAKMKRKLNLASPQSFSEKLAWLKLHDRNPIYTTMVDKYEAKKYVEDIIGKDYIIPNYGVWDHFDEIDFDKLPNQFVIKCTHDSGGLAICRNKNSFNFEYAKVKIEESLRRNYWWWSREWPYKNVRPRVIVEKYMEDETSKIGLGLTDYKFYCFNGIPKYLYVSCGLEDHSTARISFLTIDWQFAPFHRKDFIPYDKLPPKPSKFEDMISVAKRLSAGFPFLRIDLYQIGDQVFFSELTIYPCAGMMPFEPEEWDFTLGKLLKLNI